MDIKLNSLSLSELAYKRIKELIIENILKPGDRINQEKVAIELGISKIPLIQALTLLGKEGLIKKIPRRGFFVSKFNEKEINNIFDIRSVFEMLGVATLVDNLNSELEKELKKFLEDFKLYYDQKNSKKYYDLDIKFHKFIIDSTSNELISKIDEDYNLLLLCFTKGFILDWHISIKQHKEIITLILQKDKKQAEAAIRNHINALKAEYDKRI